MDMDKTSVRLIQKKLAVMGHYTDTIDGERGPNTHKAVDKGLRELLGDGPLEVLAWSDKRRTVAFLQVWAQSEDIDSGEVDGFWGPQTDFAAKSLAAKASGLEFRTFNTIVPTRTNPHGWPVEPNLEPFYGKPGKKDGFTPPMEKVPLPWTMKIAWNKAQTRSFFWAHLKVAESLARVLAKIDAAYGDAQKKEIGIDLFGGDYNPRMIRGGNRPSLHSWGIAYDFDPERNALQMNASQARLAQRDAEPFWLAWESEGWYSLGREKNFDWMHVQAAKRE